MPHLPRTLTGTGVEWMQTSFRLSHWFQTRPEGGGGRLWFGLSRTLAFLRQPQVLAVLTAIAVWLLLAILAALANQADLAQGGRLEVYEISCLTKCVA